MDDRKTFLLKMYDQMFNDIDRHHKLVWQVIGVLIAAFAVFTLTEKKIISLDIAVSIVVLLATWVIAHVYDSNYWYNRNLVIISNIERQFLLKSDLNDIQYYFGEHRSSNSIQSSLKIQLYFIWGLIILFIAYHISERIIPGFTWELSWEHVSISRALPYLCLGISYLRLVLWIKSKRIRDYNEFLQNSPGIHIDTSGIKYGGGHPIDKKKAQIASSGGEQTA